MPLVTGLLVAAVQDSPLFWDTVQLAGKHATFYFSTEFTQLLLPPAIDSGHPPTFGLYLAACWKLFGRSLPVSHWAMYPWLLLWGFGVLRALRYWVGPRWALAGGLLLLIDPVWLGQAVLVSPDIWIMVGFYWALVGIQERRPIIVGAAAVLLAATSTRGMMLTAALFGGAVVWDGLRDGPSPGAALNRFVAFVPAGLLGLAFLTWHYARTGWIGYHAGSPWAPSFAGVGWGGFAKNAAVLSWRVLDYGRWVVLPLVIWGGWQWGKGRLPGQADRRYTHWLAALLLLSVFLLPTVLLYRGLSGHRYLLPLLQWLIVGAIISITQLKNSRWQITTSSIIALSLLTGHLWVYPRAVSQQWDATLLHLAYQDVRVTAFRYLDRERIPYDSVSTVFPEIGPRDLRELNGDGRGLADFHDTATPYIWYSNVMNDFGDAYLDTLATYPAVAAWNRWGVELVLYRRPHKLLPHAD